MTRRDRSEPAQGVWSLCYTAHPALGQAAASPTPHPERSPSVQNSSGIVSRPCYSTRATQAGLGAAAERARKKDLAGVGLLGGRMERAGCDCRGCALGTAGVEAPAPPQHLGFFPAASPTCLRCALPWPGQGRCPREQRDGSRWGKGEEGTGS